MGRIEKTVFISYRRTNLPWALAIYQSLTSKGYDVFFDFQSINSGDFEQVILGNIRARAHFLVLLTPNSLDRCNNLEDWFRREIETAISEKRNIIPLFLEGFSFSDAKAQESLTGKLKILLKYNGMNIPNDYFYESMERLQQRFLNASLDAVLHPISVLAKQEVKKQQDAADKAATINQDDISQTKKFEFTTAALGSNSDYVFFFGHNGYSFNGIPEQLANTIKEQNKLGYQFKSVALGPNSSYVFFYGSNGFSYNGIPEELKRIITQKYKEGVEFKSITLGPESSYIFLYDYNGYAYNNIPTNLANTIINKNNIGVEFISASLGSNSSYAFLYNFNGYSCINLPEHINSSMEENYGQGLKYKSVALGNDGSSLFLYGNNGYASYNAPSNLINTIKELRDEA